MAVPAIKAAARHARREPGEARRLIAASEGRATKRFLQDLPGTGSQGQAVRYGVSA
jgi:hypothetical protein